MSEISQPLRRHALAWAVAGLSALLAGCATRSEPPAAAVSEPAQPAKTEQGTDEAAMESPIQARNFAHWKQEFAPRARAAGISERTLRSALAAALAGFLASGYLLLCEQHELPGGFCKISCAALITLVCILACRMLGTPASHSIIGSLMILTPGIAFTMGIRDFVHGDYLSGTIRMIDALLIAASIAIGTGLVLSLYTFFTGVVVA